ncbi:class IV adenylate cyclase [soil metagenome]
MAKNIEIKARLDDLSKARRLARKLKATPRGVLMQTDTYFRVGRGRLKLREIHSPPVLAELIWYERSDEARARKSTYLLAPVSDPRSLKMALSAALGVLVVVRKRRELWMFRNVRIHLDQVAGLGRFVELEAVVGGRYNSATSRRNLLQVQTGLAIEKSMLLSKSYSDLIRER